LGAICTHTEGLDNFMLTRKSCPLTGTEQKPMPALTWSATYPNHRAVIVHSSQH